MNKNPIVTVPELHPVPIHHPWYHVGIDFVGPITPVSKNGHRFILTLSDYFTKWVEAVPLPSKCAEGVAKTLFKVHYWEIIIMFIDMQYCLDFYEDGFTKGGNKRSRW